MEGRRFFHGRVPWITDHFYSRIYSHQQLNKFKKCRCYRSGTFGNYYSIFYEKIQLNRFMIFNIIKAFAGIMVIGIGIAVISKGEGLVAEMRWCTQFLKGGYSYGKNI